MSETYMVPWTDQRQLAGNTWAAQTFTPTKDHDPFWLAIKCRHFRHDTNYILYEIRTTLAGEPTNVILFQGKYFFRNIKYTLFAGTIKVSLKGCPKLYTGTKYAIVIREGDIVWGSYFWWRYVKDIAWYPRGTAFRSTNAGATWSSYPGNDFCFAEWGYPPAPVPPPEPPLDHFAILDVQQEYTLTGIQFIVTTNVPVHLYMLWTIYEPEKHITPLLRRGYLWKDAIRFCFVNWHQNEQEEEGDTLYHTFTKEPWAYCETRWFTFRAKVDEEWSPSVGPIFKKHRLAPDYELLIFEPWTVDIEEPDFTLLIFEPWTVDIEEPDFTLLIFEPWTDGPELPPGDYVFWEPWGTTLTQYNPWVILADPDPPGIDLTNGILTLTFTNTVHSGIIWNAPVDHIPLQSALGQPLYIYTDNPQAQAASPLDLIVNMVLFRKDGLFISLYLVIKRRLIGFGSGDYGYEDTPPHYRAWMYIGTGTHSVDLLAFFQRVAQDIGFDPDPTGWFANLVELAHYDPIPLLTSYLKNDYLALYYPD